MKKKLNKAEIEDALLPEYDFSKMKLVGRGIYAKRFRSGTNLVLLDRDVREAFPDDQSVNEALRVIANVAKRQAKPIRKNSAKGRRQSSQARSGKARAA
ncbi:MAG: hypothetical protein AABM67_15040 [Acidobacteriota bacterium]